MAQSKKMPVTESTPANDAAGTTTVARFEIKYSQFLDHLGNVLAPLPEFARDPKALVPLYRAMVFTRTFDTKAIALQRTGQLGTYASSLGEEALSVAVGSAMKPEDVLLPGYRQIAAQFLRGVRARDILLYWGGDERGSDFIACRKDFPMSIPVGSHTAHAVGVGYAMKLRREKRVAVCTMGEGGTSKGDFYEAMNAAGVWRLPVVFVINNNRYAISISRDKQTAAETIAQKAIAAGIVGEQCDGNDMIAARHCIDQALARARNGGGATLIEYLTYRLSDHTTADDARRYRKEEEVKERWQYDPIARLRGYLISQHAWNDADEQALLAECARQVEEEVKHYLNTGPMAPETMFDHLYEKLPPALAAQRDEVIRRRK